ncbi:MAG: tetratricopeptide repeat protein [Armatimonadota bacterium]|nr:tetratricopeptide repeat protein [Armatimonadota bacterium]
MESVPTPNNDWQAGAEALRQGRIEEAIAQLTAAVRSDPDSFEANNFLGVALAQAGQPYDAMYYLRKAATLNPHSAQARYNLGLAHLNAGQRDAAAAEFQNALQLDANHAQARQALESLSAPATTASTTPETSASDSANLSAASPWSAGTATTFPPPLATGTASKVTAGDFMKAAIFGFLAAIVGAFIWDKITYYTNWQIGIVAIGVGFLVGTAVSIGAGGKGAVSLQILGGLLAGFGILLGQALIIKDVVTAQSSQISGMSPIVVFIVSVMMVPRSIMSDPLTLVFIAFGVWEGWSLPRPHQPEPAAPSEPQQVTAHEETTPRQD